MKKMKLFALMILCILFLIYPLDVSAKENTTADAIKEIKNEATEYVLSCFDELVDDLMTDKLFLSRITERNSLDHMVEALNDIRYLDNQCIVYLLNSDIYLETTSKIINVTEYYSPEISKYISVNDEKIMSRTFEEKKEDINERFNILYDFKKYEWESEEEILNTKMYGTLILSNPQGQYQYNMCWASHLPLRQYIII